MWKVVNKLQTIMVI